MLTSPLSGGAKPRISARSDLLAMEGYHSPQVVVDVRLNTNESPFPPPAEWQELLADEVGSIDFHRYPDRSATALRTAIAEMHSVQADQVFAANGSNEVLQSILLAFTGHGRSVLTFEPTYALHAHIARVVGATVHERERNDDFSLDGAEVVAAVTELHPAVTFLCSPNNPSGVLERQDVIVAALDAVASLPGLLVVDEAYGQFAPWSAQSLFHEEPPLIVCRTFSKTWSMAAARLGYCIAPSWVVAEMEKVVLPYHLDATKQLAGRLALRFAPQMRRRVEELVLERERLASRLTSLGVEVWPSSANFILFRPTTGGADAVWQGLVDRGVLVRNCSSWARLHGCLRVTIGTPAEDDRFLEALQEVLS
jgi:histidinol-phosphate aminotransferase